MRPRQIAVTVAVSLLVTVGLARSAQAATISLDRSWTLLDQNLTAPSFFSGDWSWTSPTPVQFDLTDFLVVGDGFKVFDNGSAVATVSGKPDWTAIGGACTDPFTSACGWTADPDVAFADPLFNQASLLFAAGSHDITILSLAVPSMGGDSFFPDSTVAFRAEPVPEPASLLLLGTGLVVAATRLRRWSRRSEGPRA